MLTIHTIKQYTMKCPPMIGLEREHKIQEKYNTFNAVGGGKKFITDTQTILLNQLFHFTKNDFPYYTTKNIEHWVCWYGKDISVSEIINSIGKNCDIVTYWKNHTFNRSIAEINHIHVFIQKS